MKIPFKTILAIEWNDNESDDAWKEKENIKAALNLSTVKSVGYFACEDKRAIVIIMNQTKEGYSMSMQISKKSIISIKELK